MSFGLFVYTENYRVLNECFRFDEDIRVVATTDVILKKTQNFTL